MKKKKVRIRMVFRAAVLIWVVEMGLFEKGLEQSFEGAE